MIIKYHNHKPHTTPWHREEEPLNPCAAELKLMMFHYCIRLKNQNIVAIQTEFEESATLPFPQDFHNISIIENKTQQVPSNILKINVYQPCLRIKLGTLVVCASVSCKLNAFIGYYTQFTVY